MSAYVVNNETISVIAKGLVDYGVETREVKFDAMQMMLVNMRYEPVGQWLLDQNYKSVNYRYNDDEQTPKFNYEEIEANEGTLLGCINCYIYQACETPDFEHSEIYKALQTLKNKMLERMIKAKGYEIPWGI